MFDSVYSVLISGSLTLLAWLYWSRRYSQLPPGPRVWVPLFGNMLSLGPDIKHTFRKWRREYGDIFSLYIGSRLVVVFNSFDVIKDAFVTHGDLFVSRPDVFVSQHTSKGRGISSTSGRVWTEQREIAFSCFQGHRRISRRNVLEIKISEEVTHLLKVIDDERGRKVDLKHLVDAAVTNVMCSIVLGKRFEEDDPIFVEYLKRCRETFDATAILNFIPYLKYLPFDVFDMKRIEENVTFIEQEIIQPAIKRHQNETDVHNVTDFVAAYLKEIETRTNNSGSSVNEENLVKSVKDLLNAGSETIATTIRWCILFLITNPGVQEKCYQEIKSNVGTNRLPCLSDTDKLPFVQATIAEVQRCANISPLGVWHSTHTDVSFRGFTIPTGTMVFPVLDSVLMDPEVWPKPDLFKPERFLDDGGQFVSKEQWVPYSVGRRACLGISLAQMELFLFLTGLIQHYRFMAPKGSLPSTDAVPGFIYAPRSYRVQAFRRHHTRDLPNNV